MGWLVFVYFVIVTCTAVPAIFRGDIALGLSGLIAPLLCMLAGGAIPDGWRDRSIPTAGPLIIGALMIGGSLYWINSTGWNIRISSLEVSGLVLCLAGIVVGFAFEGMHNARKMIAVERAAEIPVRTTRAD